MSRLNTRDVVAEQIKDIIIELTPLRVDGQTKSYRSLCDMLSRLCRTYINSDKGETVPARVGKVGRELSVRVCSLDSYRDLVSLREAAENEARLLSEQLKTFLMSKDYSKYRDSSLSFEHLSKVLEEVEVVIKHREINCDV